MGPEFGSSRVEPGFVISHEIIVSCQPGADWSQMVPSKVAHLLYGCHEEAGHCLEISVLCEITCPHCMATGFIPELKPKRAWRKSQGPSAPYLRVMLIALPILIQCGGAMQGQNTKGQELLDCLGSWLHSNLCRIQSLGKEQFGLS